MAMGAEYCALPGLGVLGGLSALPGVEDGEDNFLGQWLIIEFSDCSF
jgi:hypothetical protein